MDEPDYKKLYRQASHTNKLLLNIIIQYRLKQDGYFSLAEFYEKLDELRKKDENHRT